MKKPLVLSSLLLVLSTSPVYPGEKGGNNGGSPSTYEALLLFRSLAVLGGTA